MDFLKESHEKRLDMHPNTPDTKHRSLSSSEVVDMLVVAREKYLKKIQDADETGDLNESFGQEIIILPYGETEKPTSYTGAIFNVIQPVTSLFELIGKFLGYQYPKEDIEACILPVPEVLKFPCYRFDLGSKAIQAENAILADGSDLGNVRTYKATTQSGISLDILHVHLNTHCGPLSSNEKNRDFQSQILTENCASLLWVFSDSTEALIFVESEKSTLWTRQQWFRKILSDMKLASCMLVGHPYFWSPVVQKRLIKAVSDFNKLYWVVTGENRVTKIINEGIPPIHPNYKNTYPQLIYKKYKSFGKCCVKAMQFYPHTRTRVLGGNYASELAHGQPIELISEDLCTAWKQYIKNMETCTPFVTLERLIQMDEEKQIMLNTTKHGKSSELGQGDERVEGLGNSCQSPSANARSEVVPQDIKPSADLEVQVNQQFETNPTKRLPKQVDERDIARLD